MVRTIALILGLVALAVGVVGIHQQTHAEHSTLQDLQHYMLDLINEEREAAGLELVTLGRNAAAQEHAENMLEGCFLSHWGLDGLKPYMRYALANGTLYDAENVSGYAYCINSDRYLTIEPRAELEDAMDGFMNSPGHRDNILDPHHSRVNIGVAYNEYQLWAVQHFEYDYIWFDRPPTINGTTLLLGGWTVNGASLVEDEDLGVAISYDPFPYNLTRGQVERTSCYNGGLPVASIVPPPPPGYYYAKWSTLTSYTECPNPYDVSPKARASQGPSSISYFPVGRLNISLIDVWLIEATEWTVNTNNFEVHADVSSILLIRGDGVYTVTLWGKVDGQDAVIGQAVIFYTGDQTD